MWRIALPIGLLALMLTTAVAEPLPPYAIFMRSGPAEIALHSRILDEERRLLIRLPLDYVNGDSAYPVLFALDAEWRFNLAAADGFGEGIVGFGVWIW